MLNPPWSHHAAATVWHACRKRAVAPGDFMEEFAFAFVAIAILALAAFAVVVQPSLSFWRSDES